MEAWEGGGVRVMRLRLSEEIGDCYLGAQQARTQAKYAHDPALKKEALDMERRWIDLARSYEFIENLSDLHEPSDCKDADAIDAPGFLP
jgi:hypothetical protein